MLIQTSLDDDAHSTPPRTVARLVRARLVELALVQAEEELDRKLPREYTLLRRRGCMSWLNYSGGGGQDSLEPVPMPALRQFLRHGEIPSSKSEHESIGSGNWTRTGSENRSNKGGEQSINKADHRSRKEEGPRQGPSKVGLKSGFLAKSKVALYPNGSDEGMHPQNAGDPLGWMPKGLRDRVNVVHPNKPSLQTPCPAAGPRAAAAPAPTTSHARTPEHLMETYEDSFKLRVTLPGVESVADVDLSVSDLFVGLKTTRANGRLYSLDLQWPEPVQSSSASARFSKKKSVLSVRVCKFPQ